jgi:hypothetical protein
MCSVDQFRPLMLLIYRYGVGGAIVHIHLWRQVSVTPASIRWFCDLKLCVKLIAWTVKEAVKGSDRCIVKTRATIMRRSGV